MPTRNRSSASRTSALPLPYCSQHPYWPHPHRMPAGTIRRWPTFAATSKTPPNNCPSSMTPYPNPARPCESTATTVLAATCALAAPTPYAAGHSTPESVLRGHTETAAEQLPVVDDPGTDTRAYRHEQQVVDVTARAEAELPPP